MKLKTKTDLRHGSGAKKLLRQLRRGIMTLAVLATTTLPCFATEGGAFGGSKFATGTIRLVQDITAWLVILAPILGGLAAGVFLLRRSMADEQDGKMWTKRAITAVCCGIGVSLVSGFINLGLSYVS